MLLWEALSSPTHCVCPGSSEEKNQQNACVCVCIYRELKNGLMWLQRWGHPKIWNQQDGDQAKPVCSSSLSLKAWEPGQPMAWVPIRWPAGLRIKKSPCFILSPEVGKDWSSSSKQPGGTRRAVPSCSACLLCSGLQLIGRGPHSLGRVICFIRSTYSAVYLAQKHPHRHTTRVVTQCLGTLWPRQSDTKNSPLLM